jgi:hypothetical protein
VGLVQRYSNNSTGVAKLRQLANLKPSRAAAASRPVPRRARRLTDAEKLSFVEGYKRGEQIADLARQLGVHRTTLDMLVARLKLSRVDPNEVPARVRESLIEKYRAGESLAVLGEESGFSANKVQRLLVSMGEPIRPRAQRSRRSQANRSSRWSRGTSRARRSQPSQRRPASATRRRGRA